MSKYLKIEYIIVLAAIVINVILVLMFLQVRKQLQFMEISAVSNYTKLQYRIVDNIKISKKSNNEDFFNPNKLLSTQGKILEIKDLQDGYYILINNFGCHDCIEGALTTINGQNFDELMFIGGNFESLNSWKLFMNDNSLNLEKGYYCSSFSSSSISNEETPIIIHLINGSIINSCIIDGSFPVEYYKYFMS